MNAESLNPLLDEREAFEKWALKSEYASTFDLGRREDGNYAWGLLRGLWNAWQARAALVAPLPTGRGRDDAIAQAVKAMHDRVSWQAELRARLETFWQSSTAAKHRAIEPVFEHINLLRNDASEGWKARAFLAEPPPAEPTEPTELRKALERVIAAYESSDDSRYNSPLNDAIEAAIAVLK